MQYSLFNCLLFIKKRLKEKSCNLLMCLYFHFMMTSVTSEELSVILEEKLEQKLAPFKSTFDELKKPVEDTKELLSFTSKQYDTLLKRLSVCEDENKKLRNENKILQKTLNKLDTSLKSVTKENNDLEQYTRRECVEIRGVPQKPDESTNTVVKEVGKAVGVEIADIDISVSHRLPPSKSYKSRKPGPPPIIVKFVRRDTKYAFYQARMKLKDMTSKALDFRMRIGCTSPKAFLLQIVSSLTKLIN